MEGVRLEVLMPSRTREQVLIDETARRYFDTATKAAEAIDGVMHSEFPLGFNGSDIYSRRDGTLFGEMMKNSLEEASQVVDNNPNAAFILRRTEIENQELPIMIDMINGQAPNTMVVISDYPEELIGADESIGGYNVDRQLAMLRIVTVDDMGETNLVSHSLDLSDRKGLEAIYDYFGIKPEPGELLGQRINVDLPSDLQGQLSDVLVKVYDNKLAELHGGEWHSGKVSDKFKDKINTYDFVVQQRDILTPYINSESYGDPNNEYGLMQLLKVRYKQLLKPANLKKQYAVSQATHMPMSDYQMQAVLHQAAIDGAREGSIFYACGGAMKAAENDYDAAGYSGNKSKEELSWHGGKIKSGTCVNCEEGPKDVGVESWCEGCIKGHCGS